MFLAVEPFRGELLDDASTDSRYSNPFEEALPAESPDRPFGLMCGNPLRRLHRGLPKTGDDYWIIFIIEAGRVNTLLHVDTRSLTRPPRSATWRQRL